MGLSAQIRRFIRRTREAAGLVFYSRPRSFPVSYDVTVKNLSHETKRFHVAAPVPPSTESQEVLHEPMFKPTALAIRTDWRYGNRYAVWRGELKPGEVASFHESFVVRVKPRRWRGGRFTLQDCRNDGSAEARLYRTPNRFLQADDARVRELAAEARGSVTNALAVLKRLNRLVVRRLSYGEPITGLYSSAAALSCLPVDCGGFDTLLGALAMAAGIPARIVSGFWAVSKNKNDMHAWVEFRLPDGSWLPVDPSVEHLALAGRTKKSGRFGFVGSDRVIMSFGCDIPLEFDDQTVYADILQHPFVWNSQGARDLEARAAVGIPKVWRA